MPEPPRLWRENSWKFHRKTKQLWVDCSPQNRKGECFKVHIHKRIRILQVKDKTPSVWPLSFGCFLFEPSLLYIQGKLQSQVHPRWAVGSQMLSFGLKHTESKNQNWLTYADFPFRLMILWFSTILCYYSSCSLELAFVVASLERKHDTQLELKLRSLKDAQESCQMRGNAKSTKLMEHTCSSLSFPAPNWLHRLKTWSMYVDRPKKMSQPQMVKCILEKAVKCVGIVRRFPLVMDAKSLTVLIYVVLIVLSSSIPWMLALSGFLVGHSPNLEPSTSRMIMPPDHLISVHALGTRYTDGSWTHDVWTSVDIFWHICRQCLMISWSISHTHITLHI